MADTMDGEEDLRVYYKYWEMEFTKAEEEVFQLKLIYDYPARERGWGTRVSAEEVKDHIYGNNMSRDGHWTNLKDKVQKIRKSFSMFYGIEGKSLRWKALKASHALQIKRAIGDLAEYKMHQERISASLLEHFQVTDEEGFAPWLWENTVIGSSNSGSGSGSGRAPRLGRLGSRSGRAPRLGRIGSRNGDRGEGTGEKTILPPFSEIEKLGGPS
ncbi:hypothetical protein AA313_de0202467 [Arthrobotrys entomopaga]|nr:hypothetical protein AA313_de0202467 [Arthrobotrys entomopaga]